MGKAKVYKMAPECWVAYIPPRGDQDFEGDLILAPYGDTYWTTWSEACWFLQLVLPHWPTG